MCGRFGLPSDHQSMVNTFDIGVDLSDDVNWEMLMPRYNVAPTDHIPVILEKGERRFVKPMRWGLIPSRAITMRGRTVLDDKGRSIPTPINARSETVESRGRFMRSFEKRRCLIPSGGFYEWGKGAKGKIPYWVNLKDRSWMAFAGLYTWWKSPEGEWVPSCAIITTAPNSLMESIHNRMPVILTKEAYDLWLNPGNRDFSDLKEVLIPYPAEKMQAHPVARLVNKTENDGPELIELCHNHV